MPDPTQTASHSLRHLHCNARTPSRRPSGVRCKCRDDVNVRKRNSFPVSAWTARPDHAHQDRQRGHLRLQPATHPGTPTPSQPPAGKHGRRKSPEFLTPPRARGKTRNSGEGKLLEGFKQLFSKVLVISPSPKPRALRYLGEGWEGGHNSPLNARSNTDGINADNSFAVSALPRKLFPGCAVRSADTAQSAHS